MEGNAVPFSTNIHLICDWNIQRRVREADSTRMVNMNVNMDTIGSYQEKKGGSTKVHERALNPWMSLEDKLILLIYQSMPLLSPKQKKVFFFPFSSNWLSTHVFIPKQEIKLASPSRPPLLNQRLILFF